MALSVSQLFEFIDAHPTFEAVRHEVSNTVFSSFRRNVRLIAVSLFEADTPDALEVASEFRRILSENLTVPLPFDHSMLEALDLLGDASAIGERWGLTIRDAFKRARTAVLDLQNVENPARRALREIVQAQRDASRSFRIICYRAARPHFESLGSAGDQLFGPDVFLHSIVDYRNAPVFDVLIKMGPLRSRGWGAVPDALLTAPRFARLEQVVWSGCHDEEGFGYDPVEAPPEPADAPSPDSAAPANRRWHYTVLNQDGLVASDTQEMPDLDDLEILATTRRLEGETSRAVLVQIDGEHGIPYPPFTQVLSFAPDIEGSAAIATRLPSESLGVGMYIIVPALADVDLGGAQADEGSYSRQWKTRLVEAYFRDRAGLVNRLQHAGIELRLPHHAIRKWCTPASTVIHAPQQRRHFEALVRVLGLEEGDTPLASGIPWWRRAWYEIAVSRGEAIQVGMQHQEIVYEELTKILAELLPTIRSLAETADHFLLDIPSTKSLSGRLRFYRVRSIEEGFQVPTQYLRSISDLSTVELWRS